MIRIRTGRRNPHTLYLQAGPEPDDADVFLGSCTTPAAAALIVEQSALGVIPVPWSGDLAQELRHAAAYCGRTPTSRKLLLDLADQAERADRTTIDDEKGA